MVILEYNRKKQKAQNVGLKPSGTSGSKKVSTKKTPKRGIEYGFDDAEALSTDYLKEVERIAER